MRGATDGGIEGGKARIRMEIREVASVVLENIGNS
jgi:hypothetical protein